MFDRSFFIRHARFTETEVAALQALRTQYPVTCQPFTDRELAHLRFMRWLVRRPEWNRALDQQVSAGVST